MVKEGIEQLDGFERVGVMRNMKGSEEVDIGLEKRGEKRRERGCVWGE